MQLFSTFGISLLGLFSFFVPHAPRQPFMPVHMDPMQMVSIAPSPRTITISPATPTPTPTMQSNPQPKADEPLAQTTPPSSEGSVTAYIMQKINEYRKSLGLSSVTTNDLTCNFAAVRAQEISTDFSHNGFSTRLSQHTLPYPSYGLITENIAQTPNYQDVVNMWIASAGHAANMRADTPYVCVMQYGSYFAYEGWKPL